MSVALSPLPAVAEVPAGIPSNLAGPIVDLAFDQRWAAWRARGDRHEASARRRLRGVAVAVLVIGSVVGLGIRLLGGGL
jgi:hypothetical protein